MRYSRGSYATGRMIPVGLVLVLVLVVGAGVGAKGGQGARLACLGLLEVVEVEEDEEGRGGGDVDRRMGIALQTLGRGGTAADLEHDGPGRAEEFRAPTRRSLDVPRMDGKVRGQERRGPGWGQRYHHSNTWCGRLAYA